VRCNTGTLRARRDRAICKAAGPRGVGLWPAWRIRLAHRAPSMRPAQAGLFLEDRHPGMGGAAAFEPWPPMRYFRPGRPSPRGTSKPREERRSGNEASNGRPKQALHMPPLWQPGGRYVKAQPREHGAGTDAEGRFSCPVFRLLSASVLSAFGRPVLRARAWQLGEDPTPQGSERVGTCGFGPREGMHGSTNRSVCTRREHPVK
jgi:hypothetical protein